MTSRIKEKLIRKEIVAGAWVTFSDLAGMEIMSQSGFDFLLIDAEHAPIDGETLHRLLVAGKGSPTSLLVRVAWNDPVRIKLVLDLGADGVVVPMVNSVDEAQRAVAACKYPPVGSP